MRKSHICGSLFRKSIFLFITLLTILTVPVSSSAALKAPDFSLQGEGDTVYRLADFKGKPLILFFFSFSCSHCEKAMPVVKELYKKSDSRYSILGVVYGTPKEELRYKKIETGTKFPVAIGTESVRKDYKVSGTPYFWVIGTDGTLKERFIGGKGAEMITPPRSPSLLKRGMGVVEELRVGLFELSSDHKSYEGKAIETGGLLIQTTLSYFPKPVFMLTNGVDKIRILPWLPLEVAPSPKGLKKQRKKVMSDFLDKYVNISGKVVLEDGKPLIEVKDAKISE
ncbi:MAG: TlpA disulfide reductase family protein [Deltaproteobacteria bacterium]|nr:TlpA disulfide reductase family protein [Deltaproteobacteria bacterium]